MRSWLAGEDEVAAGILDGGNDRLAGKQIVAEIDRPEVSEVGAVPGQPPFRGIALAVLLLRPILRRDKFRRQGQDLLVARCDHAGTQEGVEVFGAAIGAPPCRTLLALILREQKCSLPSSAIGTRPSRHWNGVSGPAASIAFTNSPSNAAGEAPSSIRRM